MTDPIVLFGTIKTGFDTLIAGLNVYKEAKEDVNALRTQAIEWNRQLLDLKEHVLNLRESIMEIRYENLDCKEKLSKAQIELKAALAEVERLKSSSAVQPAMPDGFKLDTEGIYRDKERNAYCPDCWDRSKRAVRLMVDMGGSRLRCRFCSFEKFG